MVEQPYLPLIYFASTTKKNNAKICQEKSFLLTDCYDLMIFYHKFISNLSCKFERFKNSYNDKYIQKA